MFVTLLSLVMMIDGERRGYRGAELAVSVVAISAFVLGYQQWLDGRREASFEKYYERLDAADRRLEAWPAARTMLRHLYAGKSDTAEFERYNYVYVELDNLEYVLEKYKLGYIRAAQALRGIRTLASRCRSGEFRATLAGLARLDAGYESTTLRVAASVCDTSHSPN